MISFAISAVILIFLICFGIAYQLIATKSDLQKYPPPGKLIDIDGCCLHYLEIGEGEPTVVVINGQGAISLDWQLVQPEVAKFTKIVVYDRSGYGWSELSTKPRTSEIVVDELRQMLQKAGIVPPYIVVGMSLGGLAARIFAYKYPEEVAGMVLVDVTHERIYEHFPAAMVKLNDYFDWLSTNILPTVARTGLLRLIIKLDYLSFLTAQFKKLPQNLQLQAKALYSLSKFWDALGQESDAFKTSLQQLKNLRINNTFPAIPLVVLTAGKADFGASEELLQIQKELHADLARESPDGIHIISEKSGHVMQLDEPKLVIDAILQVVENNKSSSLPQ